MSLFAGCGAHDNIGFQGFSLNQGYYATRYIYEKNLFEEEERGVAANFSL